MQIETKFNIGDKIYLRSELAKGDFRIHKITGVAVTVMEDCDGRKRCSMIYGIDNEEQTVAWYTDISIIRKEYLGIIMDKALESVQY